MNNYYDLWCIALVVGMVMLIQVRCQETSTPDSHEVCLGELLQAQCGDNQVVVLTSARWGRMRASRCVKRNYYIGCSVDVLRFLDPLCSGRPSCEVDMRDVIDDVNLSPCPGDLRPYMYLEVAYECTDVETGPCPPTLLRSPVPVSDNTYGVISSHVAMTTHCGSERAPWIIEASPGHLVELTVYDFTAKQFSMGPGDTARFRVSYTLLDLTTGLESTAVLSTDVGDPTRPSYSYRSQGNRVQITIETGGPLVNNGEFLIVYQTLEQ